MGYRRMDFQFSKLSAKCNMLLIGDCLIGKNQNHESHPVIMYFLSEFIADILSKINPIQLSTNFWVKRSCPNMLVSFDHRFNSRISEIEKTLSS